MNASLHPCEICPLRRKGLFSPFSEHELEFMKKFRVGEERFETGQVIYHEGEEMDVFYTARHGQGARYRYLPNGDRQLVNFIFPGDTIGLQAVLSAEAASTAIAASDMVLCRFSKSRLSELFNESPQRAYSLVWIAAAEEHFLGEIITTLGQRDARERMAWALMKIYSRLSALDLVSDDSVPFPFKQRDLADALGLSLVHTNKTLAQLRPHVRWDGTQLRVNDPQALSDIAMMDHGTPPERPLL
ncbi:MAG: Crp/Fnr family transcriptional regulator [Rhodobacteraceae bacterium]|nr:Crp/Fnr family transcriptional regulator [Paracoccaceae bacterium]TVR48793.1 MAG: Crp/Fnr family transcriptional regulator [Paracoccaceae bacterium]